MNKNEVAKILSERTKLKKKDCINCINALCGLIKDAMLSGESVTIKEFGSFSAKYRKEKYIYSLTTQKPMLVAAKKVPNFRPTLALKKAING